MDRTDFERLRDLVDKTIAGDLEFEQSTTHEHLLIVPPTEIESSETGELVMNATYSILAESVVFNFVIRRVGPICRVCVNGVSHRGQGRTHKHSLQYPDDALPENNLPHAVPRSDLVGLNVLEVWDRLCEEAHLQHRGRLILPVELVPLGEPE